MSSTRRRGGSAKHAPYGRLWAQDGFSVPVRITHRPDDILLVILDGAADFIDGPLTYLTLESTGGRGVLRTPGAAELLDLTLLRFVLDDQEPEVVQRREYVRVVVAKRVVLETEAGDLRTEALTVDFSGGGMLVKLPHGTAIPAGEEIYFTLYLGRTDYTDSITGTALIREDPGNEISGTARPVRRNHEDQVGFDFQTLSPRDQERLIRYVFERQRVALRMTRGYTG